MEQLSPSRFMILAVDDDQDNLNIVRQVLEHEGYNVEIADCGEDALAKIKATQPDLILLDVNMPGLSGMEVLNSVRPMSTYVSVIFVSARSETEDVIRGLDAGADDYICKPFDPHELLARVRAQLRIKDLTARLAEANARLQELVHIDDLTGLYNMRSIYQRLDNEISRSRRYDRPIAVVMMDMDDFKKVNDNHDHLFGSYVLSEVGRVIQATIRQVDFAARYGGDEFLIALPETPPEGAEQFANRLREAIAQHIFKLKQDTIRMTVSLGVCVAYPAVSPIDGKNLVRNADHCLYSAKHAGKNRVEILTLGKKKQRKSS